MRWLQGHPSHMSQPFQSTLGHLGRCSLQVSLQLSGHPGCDVKLPLLLAGDSKDSVDAAVVEGIEPLVMFAQQRPALRTVQQH